MQLLGFAAVIGAAAAATAPAPLPSPITPASDGKVQCYAPNLSAKSCRRLVGYAYDPDGEIVSPTVVLVSTTPLIVMKTVTAVTIKWNQVCGLLRPQDIASADFAISGTPATASQTEELREGVTTSYAVFFGHEICTAYLQQGDHWIARVSIDGIPKPAGDEPMAWVSAQDDFKVQP